MRLALAAAVVCALAAPAGAGVERFAIVFGHNQGESDEGNLRYAESDATKVRDVLVELGSFRAENVALLQGEPADAVRRAIITVNDRIRALPVGTEAVLLVYYSGHADTDALHLGGSRLAIDELERLVRGSAATVRLLILDSCRSGALTRVKGGRRTAGFAIQIDERLASQGAVLLTSSSATEDAQESDDLRGSFFTHYLVSGLLGAADASGDGQVSLAEAYRYAYEHTLRASSRTLAGTQHPTFRYDLSGHGEVALTRLASARRRRGQLRFPDGRSYLVLRDGEEGAVVAEVAAGDRRRTVSVRPGRYFVRGRGRDHLLEGTVRVAAGQELEVADGQLARIAYARLVRKGGGVLRLTQGPLVGARAHAALGNADHACLGALVGWALELPGVDLGVRAGWCRSGFENVTVESSLDELELELRIGKSFDLPLVTLSPFIAAGGGAFRQRFRRADGAPARTSAMGEAGAGVAASVDLHGGLYVVAEVAAQTYFFRQRDERDRITADAAVKGGLALGWRY